MSVRKFLISALIAVPALAAAAYAIVSGNAGTSGKAAADQDTPAVVQALVREGLADLRPFDTGTELRGFAGTAEHAAALHLDDHRVAAPVAELLLYLPSLDRPLQPERLAAKGRFVLFVTHRKPSFLQNASEAAVPAGAVPISSSPAGGGDDGRHIRTRAPPSASLENCTEAREP